MFGLGPSELIILAGVFVLLFGSRKIPELAKGIRDAVRNVRSVFAEAESKDKTKKKDDPLK